MAARLLFGLLAQLAGQILELVQGGIGAHQRELGLDDLQVEVPDVGEDATHPSGRVVPALAGVPGSPGWALRHSCSTMSAMARLWEPSTRMLASSRNKDILILR